MMLNSAIQDSQTQNWDLSQQPAHGRPEAWEAQLSSSHLPWSLKSRLVSDFDASMEYRKVEDFRIIRCVCDRFAGMRKSREISDTDQGYLSLLYIRKGVEKLNFDGKEIILKSGDMVIWNSQSNIAFEVLEPLEKVSILMPSDLLNSYFPSAMDYSGLVLPDAPGVGATLGNHINTLFNQLNHLPAEALSAMMRPTMEMVAATFSNHREVSPTTMKFLAQSRVKQYIMNNLGSDDLSPSSIAAKHNITPRYLHMLFQEEGISVGNWIKHLRIQRSKDDLTRSLTTRESISDIAHRWGFNDASHFSRNFKLAVGCSPRNYLNDIRKAEGDK